MSAPELPAGLRVYTAIANSATCRHLGNSGHGWSVSSMVSLAFIGARAGPEAGVVASIFVKTLSGSVDKGW
jgi:hypothetical protein